MPYIGIAARLLPLLGTLTGFLTNKAKENPKAGDTVLALGAVASAFGLSSETRVIIGKALVFIGNAIQATP